MAHNRDLSQFANVVGYDGGNIGIGENSPDRLLHLKAASSTAYSGGSDTADYNFLKIENTTDDKSAGVFFLIGSNGEAAITATEVADGNTDIAFQNRGGGVRSEKLRITSDGNLGINRTDPNQRLNVSGNIEVNAYDNTGGGGGYNTSSGLIIGNLYDAGKSYSGSDDRTACVWQERGLDLDFATNDTLRMKLTYDGNVGINTTSNNDGAHFQHYQSEVRHQSFQSSNGDLAIVTDNNSNPAAYIKGTGTADLLKVVDNSTTVFLVEDGGYVTKPNTPAFSVRRNSAQDIPHNTNTKVQWNTEVFDVGGNFDSSTNFRFTAPVAGKYLFLGHLYVYPTYQVEAKIYKNGSIYKRFAGPIGSGGNDNPNGMDFMDIIDLSVNDYVEIYALQARTGDTSTQTIYGGDLKETSFVGYLLG